jgi:hypothetical protein
MSQIDETYFQKGLTYIPNTIGTGAFQEAVINNVKNYIARFEPVFLKDLLGDDLYDAYIAGISVLPTPAARWTALRSQLLDSTNKISPIANFVYYHFQKNQQTQTTQSGDKKTNSPGMENSINSDKVCAAWNEMVKKCADIYDWLEENKATYPEWEGDLYTCDYINIFDI